jgi:hypothetical protein
VNITDPENDPNAFLGFRHILLEDWPMQEIGIEARVMIHSEE